MNNLPRHNMLLYFGAGNYFRENNMTIQILDARYWNGIIPPGYGYIRGYIAKATDGDYFTSPEFAMQYRAAKELFGRARSAWSFFKASSDPVKAAKLYHD